MSVEVLLGQSYYLRFDAKLWEAMQPYPPLGTLYAASYLRARGYNVALFDAMLAASEAEWELALERHQPRFAVLFEDNFNYLSKMCLLRMREAAFRMISTARAHGCTVITAGSDASDHPHTYLEAGADFVIIGEGEITLAELLDRLSGRTDTPFEAIAGLAWRPDAGIQINDRRPELRILDELPFPAWDLVDVASYRHIWLARHGYFSMNMAATRGCPFHCNWCAKPIWGQRYNTRSPENVAAELAWLEANYHPDHIWFVDDIFGLKPGWVPQFAELMKSQGPRLPFKSLSRVDLLLRPGEIEALHYAGCHTVWVGAESGSQKILDAMEKGTQVTQISSAAERLRAAGIRVGFFLQFGYPGETRADIAATLQIVRTCQPDDIGVSVSYPLPGTKFYQSVQAGLGQRRNWVDSSDLAMLYQGPFSTAFYRQLHRVVHTEFRLRQLWQQAIGQAIRQTIPGAEPDTALSGRLGAAARAAYYALRLPLDRLKLEFLARQPHQETVLHLQALSHAEAARPTPQPQEQGDA